MADQPRTRRDRGDGTGRDQGGGGPGTAPGGRRGGGGRPGGVRSLVKELSGSSAPAAGMSIELPLWRALTAFRLLTLAYAVSRYTQAFEDYRHPVGGWIYMGVLAAWSLVTLPRLASAERCTKTFLACDLGVALLGVFLTMAVDTEARISAGRATLPTVWAASSVLAFAVKGGWRWGAAASAVVGVANVVERGDFTERNVHNIVLLFVASTAVGYLIEVARASEATLARALRIEAATRERERLARDIHDSVLQVLAMVQRRGDELGGEAAELGRMAGEQEVALRALVTGAADQAAYDDVSGAVPVAAGPAPGPGPGGPDPGAGPDGGGAGLTDLRVPLGRFEGARVTVSAPGTPVLLPPHAAREIAAAVGAALDNVRRHAGERAHAWILLEDEPDEVLVSVRDDGPGFPPERLAAAEREGRLGVAQSIRGRLRDLGGTAELVSVEEQGAEVEMRLPKQGRRP